MGMPSPRLMPIPTTDTTASATTVLDTDSVPTDTATPMPTDTTDTTARGPLTPSPPLLLRPSPRLIPTTDTTALATTATDTDSVPTDTDTPTPTATTDTTARGPLMPSPLLPAEAEAAADPYYGYYGLSYHGLGYRAYGGYYGHGLGYYGYGHGLYGYYG